MSGRTLAELFPVEDDTDFAPEFFNPLIREISNRLVSLELLRQGLEAAISQAQDITLQRVNEILGPAALTVDGMISTLTLMLTTAQAALQTGAEEALTQIQPQINARLAAADAAIAALETAVTAGNAAIATAVDQANAARDSASAAATSANTAAGGVAAAIAAALVDSEELAIAYAVAL